jgi:hypothetical protein
MAPDELKNVRQEIDYTTGPISKRSYNLKSSKRIRRPQKSADTSLSLPPKGSEAAHPGIDTLTEEFYASASVPTPILDLEDSP